MVIYNVNIGFIMDIVIIFLLLFMSYWLLLMVWSSMWIKIYLWTMLIPMLMVLH